MELDIRHFLNTAKEQRDSAALQSAYTLLGGVTPPVTGGPLPSIAPQLRVICAEVALQLGCLEISEACLKMYFEGNPQDNQFLGRAYLCRGRLKTPPATGRAEDYDETLGCFLKAIDISKLESRCHYIVFNASVLYFQTVCPLLQPGRCQHLVPTLRQVVISLEEVADQDHSWRAELMMLLIKCLVASGMIKEATNFAKATEEFIKEKTPHLYPRLFALLVYHKLTKENILTQTSRKCTTSAVIFKIQRFKRLEEKAEVKKEELEPIFSLLVDSKSSRTSVQSSSRLGSARIQPADRVALLLELAVLALQLKHQKVAANCLKELKLAGEASAGQLITMACIKCELKHLKSEGKMNEYSKAAVEDQLKEIYKLDQWLQTAVREGDPQVIQTVCTTQWNFCLPLLQHNLKKRIKTPLLNVAQELEDIQSMFLKVRCQLHSELAVIEEEDGRLEASLTHLEKATQLDNGTQQERLSSARHLLQLRRTLYQTPSKAEDKAAMLMQQVKERQPNDKTDIRPILVAVGLLLAPDDFQMVLDAENTSKVPEIGLDSGAVARRAAKAEHHSTSVERVEAHLAKQGGDEDSRQRVKLWAALVKTARKYEVWDVCRAACRFCLLYDDRRRKVPKAEKSTESSSEGSRADSLQGSDGSRTCEKDQLRLFAEICFISAEATVQKLHTEGVHLNSAAVPAIVKDAGVSEEDPHWIVYRDWIHGLSAHATSDFLWAAELGAEIREPWLVENTAVYLWNYSTYLLAAGEYARLRPTFQTLVEIIRKTEYTGSCVLFGLLCDAVARGLIQPLRGRELSWPENKVLARPERKTERDASAQGGDVDLAAMGEAHKLCEFALQISNRQVPGESFPIAARKQVLATWVQIKWFIQQQIDANTENAIKCESEEMLAMTRVLVGLEMIRRNRNRNPGHMEFSVPALSDLASMASECIWTDAVVELQVWCQLAAFCHYAEERGSLLSCIERALRLEGAAASSLSTLPCVFYAATAVNEMLSSVACLRGLSLLHESNRDLQSYKEAMKVLLSSVSYAEKAVSPALCVTSVKHYWNAGLPLTQTPEERWQLQEPLEKILTALLRTTAKNANKQEKKPGPLTPIAPPHQTTKQEATDGEDLNLRLAIYSLLLYIHGDKADWRGALKLLDQAVKHMPSPKHQLHLQKQRILVKARLGLNILVDMEKMESEGEECCSFVWHQVALSAGKKNQQLACYQKSITSLTSMKTQQQKVGLLFEFGEWLYSHNFPTADAQHQIQWAVDILLQTEPDPAHAAEDKPKRKDLTSVRSAPPVGVRHSLFTQSVSDLKEVWRLDNLVRAHTLLAVMADRTSPEHQQNLLRAHIFVLQIWRVSMEVTYELSTETTRGSSHHSPHSAGPKKSKDKEKDKVKGKKVRDSHATDERSKSAIMDQTLPSTPKDWACYVCPERARLIFRTDPNPHCINKSSIKNQTHSLFFLDLLVKELRSLMLDHLTLAVLHLAETIAHDLVKRSALADVYRLRIVKTCRQLGLETGSPYEDKLMILSRIQETEQILCTKETALVREKRSLHKRDNQKSEEEDEASSWRRSTNECTHDIWLNKAEVCIGVGFYQAARQLLSETHAVAVELGNQRAVARSLLGLAGLSCKEQDYVQALILLDKAEEQKGDEEFWYQLTLTKLTAIVGQRDHDALKKVDQIVKQGCGVLKQIRERRVNRAAEMTLLMTSLEMRGASKRLRALGSAIPGEALTDEDVQGVKAVCETFRECATAFATLGSGQHAAGANAEFAHGLRILAHQATQPEDKQRLLLDGLYQMQLAVTQQEGVVLNARRTLPSQKNIRGLSLAAVQGLLRLRLTLVEFCLAILEQHCAVKKEQALAREKKSAAEIILEDFTRCTPEPHTLEEEWERVGSTLGQVALGQLAAVRSLSVNKVEIRARCLNLMGRCLRLLAAQDDPLYLCALWDERRQTSFDLKAASAENKVVSVENKVVSVENEDSESKKEDGGSNTREPRMTSGNTAEQQQQRSHRAQQLMAQASNTLAEAVKLCLKHRLPASILTDASLHMLECHGLKDPAVAGQYLALFQSCCTASTMAEVLRSVCGRTSTSRLSALFSLHSELLSQEERPGSMLKGAEDSLNSLSKAFSHLTINPNHLNILAELPPNFMILLLQHSTDGSELYGAFYETGASKENATQATGALMCSGVAKASVCPQALLALRDKTRAFGQETSHALHKEACWRRAQSKMAAFEENQVFGCEIDGEQMLEEFFREIIRDTEEYLKPLLAQLDFSWLRKPAALSSSSPSPPPPPDPEMTVPGSKEEKGSSEAYLILLADIKLLELPLEALSILQEGSLSCVSRDFSLQLLYSRLTKDPEKVESDNRRESKCVKGGKKKVDQSQVFKGSAASHLPPPNSFPINTRNFKYIVDPRNDGKFEDTCLRTRMEEVLISQPVTLMSEGDKDSKQSTSLYEMEQLLCRSSAFVYLGRSFLENIPPAKVATLDLTGCCMALLFDLIRNSGSAVRQSNVDLTERSGKVLEKSLETALLLSLDGVGCVALNQWHCSLQQNIHNMANALDILLRVRQTSGYAIHALRTGYSSEQQDLDFTGSQDQVLHKTAVNPSAFNCVFYGIPNYVFM